MDKYKKHPTAEPRECIINDFVRRENGFSYREQPKATDPRGKEHFCIC
jgi:hypothetical protein